MRPFKEPVRKIFLLVVVLTFASCKKEEETSPSYSIRYELISDYHYDALIQWTEKDGGVSGSNVEDSGWEEIDSGVFSYSFESSKELNIHYMGQNTNSLADVKIKLFVNDSLVQSAEANSQLEAIIKYQI